MSASHPAPVSTISMADDGMGVHIEGQLMADAQVRMQAPAEGVGRARPVLVLDLDNVGPHQLRVHVEKPYEEASRFVVDALALRLKRGTSVRISTPFQHARLALNNADQVIPIPLQDAE